MASAGPQAIASAVPRPCATLAGNNAPKLGANEHAASPIQLAAKPILNMRLRP